jgi:tetratricopeptide (TPR) repeat protein
MLARESGKNKSEISAYEKGKRRPRPKSIAAMVRGARLAARFAAEALPLIRRLRIVGGLGRVEHREDEKAEAVAARLAVPAGEAARAAAAPRLVALYAAEEEAEKPPAPPAAKAPEQVAELWGVLAPLKEENDARILVEKLPELWSEGLCRRLCDESERAAANDPTRAQHLADLALRVAQRVEGEPPEKAYREGYARAFLGNSRRVGSDLRRGQEEFDRAQALWASLPPGLVRPEDKARVLDLEASLRRDQRRFDEALRLHAEALKIGPAGQKSSILLNKAVTLQHKGDHEQAVATLIGAMPAVDPQREPRLFFGFRFNLAANLAELGRHAAAEPLVAEVKELAASLDLPIYNLRVRWLEGKLAAGLGRIEEAIALLREVQAKFIARKNPYNTALVTLELAALLAERGETAEVMALATAAAPVFEGQGVHREALACFRLFENAARRQAVTAAFAHSLVKRLTQAP